MHFEWILHLHTGQWPRPFSCPPVKCTTNGSPWHWLSRVLRHPPTTHRPPVHFGELQLTKKKSPRGKKKSLNDKRYISIKTRERETFRQHPIKSIWEGGGRLKGGGTEGGTEGGAGRGGNRRGLAVEVSRACLTQMEQENIEIIEIHK